MSEPVDAFNLFIFARYLWSHKLRVILVALVVGVISALLLYAQFPQVFQAEGDRTKVVYKLEFGIDQEIAPTLELLGIDYFGFSGYYVHVKKEIERIVANVDTSLGLNETAEQKSERVRYIILHTLRAEFDRDAKVISLSMQYDDARYANAFLSECFSILAKHLRNLFVSRMDEYLHNENVADVSKTLSDTGKIEIAKLPGLSDTYTQQPSKRTVTQLGEISVSEYVLKAPKVGLENVNAILVLFFSAIFVSFCVNGLLFSVTRLKKTQG